MAREKERIFGWHAVLSALERSGHRVRHIWMEEGRADGRASSVMRAAAAAHIPVQRIGHAGLDVLAGGGHHQGVAAECDPLDPASEQDLDALLSRLTQPLLLVLDGVQDPHNLGACLRSADAAGAHAVILPRDNAVSVTPVVRKVASGAAETVPVIRVTNLARTLDSLKAAGLWIAGASGEAQDEIFTADLGGPLALVLGAEGRGLRRLTRERCDFLVRIPMSGSVASLNVSAAAAVCLYEAVRQRRAAGAAVPQPELAKPQGTL